MPVFFENNRFRYRSGWWAGKHLVLSKVSGIETVASAPQIEQLRSVFLALREMPWPSEEARNIATTKVYIAFCLTVHGFPEVSALFMSQDPATVALVFGTMPEK